MYNHAPENYDCIFCRIVREIADGKHAFSVFQNNTVSAFMSLHDMPNNLGHVLVIPNEHYENIYDLPVALGADIHACAKDIALAMKAVYHCDGISLRQHNEPAGNQDVWHYHLHVFPRYAGDNFSSSRLTVTPEQTRVEYAAHLRAHLENQDTPTSPHPIPSPLGKGARGKGD
jgi:histidine triad (HIT) family protein